MTFDRIIRIVEFLRFLFNFPFLKKSGVINFVQKRVQFRKSRSITIGNYNKFNSYSRFIIGSYTNKECISIGDRNVIASFAFLIAHGGYIKLGNRNFIGERTQIQGKGGVEIGNNVLIAANVFISSSNHNFDDPLANDYLKREIPKKTIIKDNVWIGANCVIVAGVELSEFCIIAAGTIVTKNVEQYSIVAGNPSRVIKRYDKRLKEWVKVK